jgi:diguanylate cyclase (GGDEF)-like protein/PAS domain S-box-containing protein
MLLIVLLAIIPALGLILYGGLEARRLVGEQVRERAAHLVEIIAQDQEQSINEARQLLVTLAQLPVVWGQQGEVCGRVISAIARQQGRYANLGALLPDGRLFCSALPFEAGARNARESSWFRQALETTDFAVGHYQIGGISNKPVLTMAYPARDARGVLRAVVFASIDLAWLNRYFSQASLPPGSTLGVIDRRGVVLARYPDPEFWVGQNVDDEAFTRHLLAAREPTVFTMPGMDGEPQLFASRPLMTGNVADTHVYLGIPRSMAFAEAERVLQVTLIGLGIAALLALVAAWWGGASFLLRRVQALVGATQRVAQGDLTARSGLRYGPGELSQLARAFDDMAAALQRRSGEVAAGQAALARSEAHYRRLVDTAEEGIWLVDADARTLSLNPKMAQMLALDAAEARGRPMLDYVAPEDRTHVQTVCLVPQRNGRCHDCEVRFIARDGREFWALLSTSPMTNERGEFEGMLAMVTDISARKQAERQLQARAEEALRLHEALQQVGRIDDRDTDLALTRIGRIVAQAVQVARVSVWRYNDAHDAIVCAALCQPGRTDSEGDMPLAVADYPAYFAALDQHRLVAAHDAARDPRTCEFAPGYLAPLGIGARLDATLRRQGQVVGVLCLEHVGAARTWTEGEQAFAASVADRISLVLEAAERRRAEERLRRSEQSLKAAQRIGRVGNWEWDLLRDSLWWSDEMYRIYGRAAATFMPSPPMFLAAIHPDDRERVQLTIDEARSSGRSYQIDHRIRQPDGHERSVAQQVGVVTDGHGRAVAMIGVVQDITERKQTEERLQYLAHYDSLTGLPNRTLYIDRLQQTLYDADRHERLVAAVFLDLDRFKNVNDSLGHAAGDALLRDVAQRLAGTLRRGDTVARLGGDEFAMAWSDIGHVDDAARIARKIIDVFAQPFYLDGRALYVTASLGITLYPFDDRDVSTLLRNADVAMYHAKTSGRNNYQFYAAAMTAQAAENLALENALRAGIQRREFFLAYQPVVDLGSGAMTGMEALLRWDNAERGLIAPAQFIPLAEDNGYIVPLGEWVLHEACRQGRCWHDAGYPLRIGVNVSARQFQHPGFAASVARILGETGFRAQYLDIELTESVIMQQAESNLHALETLSQLGIAFSIDDFGTGYSSLSYLKRFPIDTLKIDRSFVRDIPRDPDDSAIAQAIITMAHSLGIKVVAEGVEEPAQIEFLRSRRCDAMQGFLFSQPVVAGEIDAMLREHRGLAAPVAPGSLAHHG